MDGVYAERNYSSSLSNGSLLWCLNYNSSLRAVSAVSKGVDFIFFYKNIKQKKERDYNGKG